MCNAQCFTGPRDDCASTPTSPLEGAGTSQFLGLTVAAHWMQYLWLGVIALSGLTAVSVTRVLFCPKKGSTFIMGFVSFVMLLVGVVLTALFLVVVLELSIHSTVDLWAVEVEEFLDTTALYVLLAIGAALMLVGLVTCGGMCFHSRKLLLAMMVFWVLLLITIFATAAFLAYWISTLDDVTSDQLATLQGSNDGQHDGAFGALALREVEGFVCRTYQRCCRDPALDVGGGTVVEWGSGTDMTLVEQNRTCLQAHEGTTSDIALTMEDPSAPNFCPYLTGSFLISATPPESICKLVDLIHEQAQCQSEFCTLGSEGYFDFVLKIVAFMRNNVTWIVAGLSITTLFQLVLIVNLWNLSKRIKKEKKVTVELTGPGELAGAYPK